MVKALPLLVVCVVVFAVAFYGGHMASSTMSELSVLPPAESQSCITERSLRADLQVLEETRDRLRAQLIFRYEDQGAGPMRFPEGAMSPATIEERLEAAVGGDEVVALHCREYPCVAVLAHPPGPAALEALTRDGLAPEGVVGASGALVLADAAFPPPPRTRARALALRRAAVELE